MNPNDIRKRQVYIKGEPLKDRLLDVKSHRRQSNFVDTPQVENIEFDTFFDYEDDLSGLKPSNEQADSSLSDNMIMVRDNNHNDVKVSPNIPDSDLAANGVSMVKEIDSHNNFVPTAQHGELGRMPQGEVLTPVIMRPVYKKNEIGPDDIKADESTPKVSGPKDEVSAEKRKYDDVVGFEFVRCEYIMKNERQCKRQAPKNSTICSIHKKMLNK